MRWPGRTQPGGTDGEHFISGIDLMPSVLDAVGVACPAGVDGTSFLPLLRGETQTGRQMVFTQFHQTAGRRNYPMRCVQTRRYGYIFNPWSNGAYVFRNESQAGRTMAAMRAAAERDPALAARVELFLYRVPEELYDFRADPDALHNLVDDPDRQGELERLRNALEQWMVRTRDPALGAFRDRSSRPTLDAFMRRTAGELGGTSE
jgi:N-sulfoglucosamine sulfohydrolase